MNKTKLLENNLEKSYKERFEFWLDEHRWAAVVLGVVAIGGVLTVGAFAPNMFKVVNSFKKRKFNNKQKKALSDARLRLLKQGYIKKENSCYIITKKGGEKLEEYNFKSNFFNKKNNKKWDNKWRFLLFDYPQKEKNIRDTIRKRIKLFGFFQFQKNVWTYPYKEAGELLEYFHLYHGKGSDSLVLVTVDRFVGDKVLKDYFEL